MIKNMLLKSALMIMCFSVLPCRADTVNVDTSTLSLNFGKVVPLASHASVSIDSNGVFLFLSAMRSNSSETLQAGTITFSSEMSDGYDTLIIRPNLLPATELAVSGAADCDLRVTNFSFSSNAVTLSQENKSADLSLGGEIHLNGTCANLSGNDRGVIGVPYTIYSLENEPLKSGTVNLPVRFGLEIKTDIVKDNDLNFGTIITDGTAGYVTLSPVSGLITYQSAGILTSGTSTAGEVSIYGASGQNIASVSFDESVTLYGSGDTLTVDTFTSYPDGAFSLTPTGDGMGYQKLKIGGTLHLKAHQTAGEYRGVAHVYISY